jgi:methionyl-tRNA formyltransferase
MKIIFMGTPQFASQILEQLIKAHEVLLVVTQPDRKTGRKQIEVISPVKEVALNYGIKVFQPEKLSMDYDTILNTETDIIVTAAYGQKVPNAVLNYQTCINVHGSLLPKYRGGAPIQKAIMNGEKETGITIMHMVEAMDAGNSIAQEAILIDEHDTYTSLSHRLSELGATLLLHTLNQYGHEMPIGLVQDQSQVTFAKTLKRQDERINFHQNTEHILRQIRALNDQPGAFFMFKDKAIKIYEAKKSDIITHEIPGTILQVKKKLIISTLDGAIDIIKLQIPGKKQMYVRDFLNGQTLFQIHERCEDINL